LVGRNYLRVQLCRSIFPDFFFDHHSIIALSVNDPFPDIYLGILKIKIRDSLIAPSILLPYYFGQMIAQQYDLYKYVC